MKIRNGFVSNSSSSSFIIGVNGELTEEKLLKAFGVNKESQFYYIFSAVAEELCSEVEQVDIQKYKDEYSWSYKDYYKQVIDDIEKKKLNLYKGSIASYGDGGEKLQNALAHTSINYSDDTLVLFKGNSW